MIITEFNIKNVRSFKETTCIKLDPQFNILIGPNGSGKSNLLDIIHITIRHFFFSSYQINYNKNGEFTTKYIYSQNNIFGNIHQVLDKFMGCGEDSEISLTFRVTADDIQNMIQIQNHKSDLLDILQKFSSVDNNIETIIKAMPIAAFTEGEEHTYTIKNNALNFNIKHQESSQKDQYLLFYMHALEGLILLTQNTHIHFSPALLFISSFRSVNNFDLMANLSERAYNAELPKVTNITSKSSSSLITLASIYFAEKLRDFESRPEGYVKLWKNDEQVNLISKYLKQLGYEWSLKLVDKNKNQYQIELISKQNGNRTLLAQSSSGEIEMINFILGLTTLNIRQGLLIIDEPELHLHPKWSSMLLNLLLELSHINQTQFIISTHSPTFITNESYHYITRVYKDKIGVSRCHTINEHFNTSIKDMLHIINSTNNEKIFFADKVIMVEGITDRLVFQRILREITDNQPQNKVIEIIEVKGKHNVDKYRQFMNNLMIPSYFITDLDYVNENGTSQLKQLFTVHTKRVVKDVLKNPESMDHKKLVEYMNQAIASGNLTELQELWEYIKSFRTKLKSKLSPEEQTILKNFINNQQQNKTFILQKGDIEDYFPAELHRKDLDNVLKLLDDIEFKSWKKSEEYKELCDIMRKIEKDDLSN